LGITTSLSADASTRKTLNTPLSRGKGIAIGDVNTRPGEITQI
jgi:hypothetical protein